MTAVDDELMRPSVCGTIPVLREKGAVGFGSPKERGKKPQHRTGLRLFCSYPSFGGPNGEAQASPVTLRVPRSSTPVRAAAQCGSWSAVVHQERLEHPTCSQNTNSSKFASGFPTTAKQGPLRGKSLMEAARWARLATATFTSEFSIEGLRHIGWHGFLGLERCRYTTLITSTAIGWTTGLKTFVMCRAERIKRTNGQRRRAIKLDIWGCTRITGSGAQKSKLAAEPFCSAYMQRQKPRMRHTFKQSASSTLGARFDWRPIMALSSGAPAPASSAATTAIRLNAEYLEFTARISIHPGGTL